MKNKSLQSCKIHRRDSVSQNNFEQKTVENKRVSNVVKGGRRFSFSSLVVIGNGDGCFGYGLGKSNEVSLAKEKATNAAKNCLFNIVLTDAKTIPHEVEAKFKATTVMMKPAKPGTGIIAGGAMRAILEHLGVKDVVAKIISGPSTPNNVVRATEKALLKLKSMEYYIINHGLTLPNATSKSKK